MHFANLGVDESQETGCVCADSVMSLCIDAIYKGQTCVRVSRMLIICCRDSIDYSFFFFFKIVVRDCYVKVTVVFLIVHESLGNLPML